MTTVVEKTNERKLVVKPFAMAKPNWDAVKLTTALKEVGVEPRAGPTPKQ